jgi:hypothetical protein
LEFTALQERNDQLTASVNRKENTTTNHYESSFRSGKEEVFGRAKGKG